MFFLSLFQISYFHNNISIKPSFGNIKFKFDVPSLSIAVFSKQFIGCSILNLCCWSHLLDLLRLLDCWFSFIIYLLSKHYLSLLKKKLYQVVSQFLATWLKAEANFKFEILLTNFKIQLSKKSPSTDVSEKK